MSNLCKATVATALILGLVPSLASAKPLRRQKAHTSHARAYAPRDRFRPGYAYAPGYARTTGPYGPTSADSSGYHENPYSPYAARGAAIRELARRNQNAPGVTNELAPDNIATATGGPSGGVPGFSSH